MAGGRGLGVSMGGSSQVVNVKTSGAHGVMGSLEEKQLVSKKVSYKVDIDCCFISLLIVGIAYAAIRYIVLSTSVFTVCGDLS